MTIPLSDNPASNVDPYYEPFDQDKWLPAPPWRPDDPALIAWEKAHGHDVRLKCYVEYGCQVIESTLERQLAAMTVERDEARAERDAARVAIAGLAGLVAERDAAQDKLNRIEELITDLRGILA